MATLDQVQQEWNKYRVWNQLFKDYESARKAQKRRINTWDYDQKDVAKAFEWWANYNKKSSSEVQSAAKSVKNRNISKNRPAVETLASSWKNTNNKWSTSSDGPTWNVIDPTENQDQWTVAEAPMADQTTQWDMWWGQWAGPQKSSWANTWWQQALAWGNMITKGQSWSSWQWWSGPSKSSAYGWATAGPWWVPMVENTTSVGNTLPNSDANIKNETAQNVAGEMIEQESVNNIAPEQQTWIFASADSDFWNKFWQPAIEQEQSVPWYMSERNKVIAKELMLEKPAMKYLSNEARINMIIEDIVQRQWQEIDPNILDRYESTAENINNMITQNVPPYTANDYFNMMLRWDMEWDVSQMNSNNPSFKAAKNRYNNLKKYSSMDTTWLSSAIKSWNLTPWSVAWNDLINKGMWEVLNKANVMYETNMTSNIYDTVVDNIFGFDPDVALAVQKMWWLDLGTGLEAVLTTKLLTTLTDDQYTTFGAYLAQDQDVQSAKAAAKESEDKLNELWQKIEDFADDIKATVVERWWEATWDPFLEAYISEKTKPFLSEWKALNSQYRNEMSALELASDNAKVAFESAQYNREMKMKWYQLVLSMLQQQNANKAAADKMAYDVAKDERDWQYKVAKDQRDYELDLAKFNLSARWKWWWGVTAPQDILKWIYNGTLSSKNILNEKTLSALWLDNIPPSQQIATITNAMIWTYLTKDSSYSDINNVISGIKSTFDKEVDSQEILDIMNSSLWPQKTMNYTLSSDWRKTIFWDEMEVNEESIATIASTLSSIGNITQSDANIEKLYDKLADRWNEEFADMVIDAMWVDKQKKWRQVWK